MRMLEIGRRLTAAALRQRLVATVYHEQSFRFQGSQIANFFVLYRSDELLSQGWSRGFAGSFRFSDTPHGSGDNAWFSFKAPFPFF